MLANKVSAIQFFASIAIAGAMFLISLQASAAAELIMFEQAGCPWCKRFDHDIGGTYNKTEDGLRAPLRRVDITVPMPPELSFIHVERLTPLFVLVDQGREIGRIRGHGYAKQFLDPNVHADTYKSPRCNEAEGFPPTNDHPLERSG